MVDFGSLASWCEPRATPCKPGSRECGQAPRTAQRPSDPRPMAPPALCLARRRASCDTKTKPQPRRAIRARLFDLCSQRKPVTHASRSQHVRSPPVVSCMPCALCAVPCGQKRLFLKNLGRGLAGCIAFQHALCMCRECQSACLAPFLRACPIAESGLPQCVHKRVGFLGGGHCDCIAAVLHFCLVEHTHALHPQGYWTTRPVATLLSATPPCGSTSSRASSTLVAVALLWMPCRRRSKCRYMGLREAAQRARRVARHVCHIRTCKLCAATHKAARQTNKRASSARTMTRRYNPCKAVTTASFGFAHRTTAHASFWVRRLTSVSKEATSCAAGVTSVNKRGALRLLRAYQSG